MAYMGLKFDKIQPNELKSLLESLTPEKCPELPILDLSEIITQLYEILMRLEDPHTSTTEAGFFCHKQPPPPANAPKKPEQPDSDNVTDLISDGYKP